jgi:hypothetical protein
MDERYWTGTNKGTKNKNGPVQGGASYTRTREIATSN